MYFGFMSVLRESIGNDKIIKILNRGLYVDFMFMTVFHTLATEKKGVLKLLNEIGIKTCTFLEDEILLDKYQIKMNKSFQ